MIKITSKNNKVLEFDNACDFYDWYYRFSSKEIEYNFSEEEQSKIFEYI